MIKMLEICEKISQKLRGTMKKLKDVKAYRRLETVALAGEGITVNL